MDKTITCKECNTDFTLTEGEQQFFKQMAYQEPKRCKVCRTQRKQAPDTNQTTREQRGTVQWIDGSHGSEHDGDKPRNHRNRRRNRFKSDDTY